MNKIFSMFRVLKYKNFKLLYSGLIIGQIGIWIYNITLSWIVYDNTQSAALMGIIMFLISIPQFMVTPFAGVVIDKYYRRKLLIGTQILYALLSSIIVLLAVTGTLVIWNIALLGILINLVSAFDAPVRQSMYIYMIKNKHELQNAISLNSSCINLARLIGPAIGSSLMLSFGIGFCFCAASLCFIPAAILFFLININEEIGEKIKKESILEGLIEGFDYIKDDSRICIILAMFIISSFFGMVYSVLMPIYTSNTLRSDVDIYGLIMSFVGAGALITSLIIALNKNIDKIKYVLSGGILIWGMAYILLSVIHNSIFSIIVMFIVGAGMTSCVIASNSLLQTIIVNEKRGRIMSIHSLCFYAFPAISCLISGYIVQYIGINKTLFVYGVILIIATILFFPKLKKMTI